MIVLDLPPTILAQVESMSARAGMTASSWLAEQIAHAFGTGRVIAQDPAQPPRKSRSARRRIAAAKRAARAAARASLPTETTND